MKCNTNSHLKEKSKKHKQHLYHLITKKLSINFQHKYSIVRNLLNLLNQSKKIHLNFSKAMPATCLKISENFIVLQLQIYCVGSLIQKNSSKMLEILLFLEDFQCYFLLILGQLNIHLKKNGQEENMLMEKKLKQKILLKNYYLNNSSPLKYKLKDQVMMIHYMDYYKTVNLEKILLFPFV